MRNAGAVTFDGNDTAGLTPLRRTRAEFGWKVPRLIVVLRRCARQVGVTLGSDKTLKSTISRHENGHVIPGPDWRKLYRLAYGRTDEELGFGQASVSEATGPGDDLPHRLATARRVDLPLVQQMRRQVDHIRLLDRRLGAASLLEQSRSVITTLSDLVSHSLMPSTRMALAATLADAAALAAWQALDTGAVRQAWRHYETAKSAAREAESSVLLAHAMGEQAYALHDVGRISDALLLVHGAQTVLKSGPPRLRCWLSAVEAETQAALGHDDCRKAIERSARLLPASDSDPELPFITLNSAHHARWRGHCLAQIGDGEAIGYLTTALEEMDPSFVRATAGLRCDLAQALATRGELDEARTHLRAARQLANQVGSVRQRRRIMSLGLAA